MTPVDGAAARPDRASDRSRLAASRTSAELRCWLPESRRVAGPKQLAQRQITGFLLNGQLLSGFFIWLSSRYLRSAGDFFAGTVLLYDPDGVLPSFPPAKD